MKLLSISILVLQALCISYAAPTYSFWSSTEQIDSENGLEVSDPKTLRLVVESFGDNIDAQNIGLTKATVEERARLRLLEAGILPSEELTTPLDPYYLYVRVTVTPLAYSIDVELIRILYFDANGESHRFVATTWDTSSVGEHRRQTTGIMNALDRHLENFLDSYRQVNWNQ